MAALRTTLCAVFMVTVALSKPVCLSEGEDSSKSSESSETNSSEENATGVGLSQEPLQPAFTETDMPNAMEENDPLDTAAADAGPSTATLDPSTLPDPEDPQSSTDADALQLMPDDPSQTALGIDISQDKQLRVTTTTTTTTYQGFPREATPPFPPHATETTPPPFSTAPPLPIGIETALTGVPVCFTFQFVTPEPAAPRGDSI